MLCVELRDRQGRRQRERIRADLLRMAQATPRTGKIRQVLFHPGFPVDIRHNAKIGREQLAAWATRRLP